MAMLRSPKLLPIDAEMVLFGSVHIEWSDCGVESYYLYRDYEPVTNIEGWTPYAIIENKKFFDDSSIQNGRIYFYAIQSVSGQARSALSNTEKVKVNMPAHLIVEHKDIQEVAYFESLKPKHFDEKIWHLARLQLVIEGTFPSRTLDYLKVKVKSLKKDLPEFNGLLMQPMELEIRKRAEQIYQTQPKQTDIDWRIAEKELILSKIQELMEFQSKIR